MIKTKSLGMLYIPKFEIRSIVEIKDKKSIINDEYQPAGPFTTRYSFTSNALPIKKGENYGMINIHGPELHLALTNRLNVGIMTTWIASPMILVTKYSFIAKDSKVNFSFGTLLGTSGYLNSFKGYGGLNWLTMTIGDRKNNISFSGGYAYLQTGILNDEPDAGVYPEEEYQLLRDQTSRLSKMSHGPIISIAGFFKIGGKSSFIFDSMIGYFNYEILDSDGDYNQNGDLFFTVTRNNNAYSTALFLMPGVRFQSSDRKAFQICVAGVAMFGDTNVSFPIPMCSWFYKF